MLFRSLEISNTEPVLLEWIHENFGGRVSSYTPKQTPKNSRKPVYKWTCEGERLTHICELIYPFSVIKKGEIEIVLKMRFTLQKPTSRKGKQGVQPLAQEELDYRHTLYLGLKKLHCRS